MHRQLKHIATEGSFFIFSFYFSRGLRMAFAMLVPIFAGWLTHNLEFGILVSSGAFIAGIGDNPGSFKIKLYTQLIGVVFYFIVITVSQLLQPYPNKEYTIYFGIWVTFCGFFFSMFFIYGSRAISVATASLLCIVYAHNFHKDTITTNTTAFMVGVLFYGVTSLLFWRIQPYRVIEQKISENIKLLSEYISLINEYFILKTEQPLLQTKQTDILGKLFEKQEKIHAVHEEIRENLFKLRINAKSFSARGRRLTLIFSALIDLYEQLISLNLQDDELTSSLKKSKLEDLFKSHLSHIQYILNSLAWSISLDRKTTVIIDTSSLEDFKQQILHLEKDTERDKSINLYALKHIRFIFRSFYKQTRNIKLIINEEFVDDKKQYLDLELSKFTRQYTYNFATFKANLNFRSHIFKHALRMALAILVSYSICILLEINYFSWIFLTIILILKPDYGNTKSFSLKRLWGTLIGAGITLLILLSTNNLHIIAAIILISIIGAYSFLPVNYKVGVTFVTIFVILLIFLEHQGSNNIENIYHRLGGTAIAIIIAFVLSFIFLPVWEYKKMPSTIGKSLNYTLKYFQAITYNLINEEKISDTEVKLVRRDLLLSVSNLSGTFQRIISEPKLSKEYKSNLYTIQNNINLLSTRISSLRAYNTKDIVLTPNDAELIQFTERVLNNCIAITKGEEREIKTMPSWEEIEINLSFQNNNLISYQLKEISSLVQQIYNYIQKMNKHQEWEIAKKELGIA